MKKYIQSIFMSVLLLAAASPLYAQWADDDLREIKVLREPNNTQTATIGKVDNDETVCYEWFGPDLDGIDVHQPVITVNPTADITVYRVIRKGKCGAEEGQVIVRLVDSVKIVKVTPKRECYVVGEKYKLEHFEIETEPLNYQSSVLLYGSKDGTRDTAYVSPDMTADVDSVFFILSYNDHVSMKGTGVTVFNKVEIDYQPTTPHPLVSEVKGMVERVKGFINNAQSALEDIKKLVTDEPQEFDLFDNPFWKVDHGGFKKLMNPLSLQCTVFRSCCEGDESLGFHVIIPRDSGYFSVKDIKIHTIVGVPGLGGLFVKGDFLADAAIGVGELYYRGGLDCIDGSIPIDLSVTFSGGLESMLVDDDFISAKVYLQFSNTIHLDWKVGDQISFEGFNFVPTLEIVLTCFAFEPVSVSVPLKPILLPF